MATCNSRDHVDAIIRHNGWADPSYATNSEDGPADPPAIKIVEYTNMAGRTCWGVVFANEHPTAQSRYEVSTQFVRNPRVIWSRKRND